MAEEDKASEAAKETAELEALLENQEGGAAQAARRKGVPWRWLAGGGLLIVLFVLADQFLFSPALSPPVEEAPEAAGNVPAAPPEAEKPAPEESSAGAGAPSVKAGRVIALEPFFLPLTEKGVETGRYIRMTPNFLVSDDFRDKELEVTLPLIRKNIYNILERKEASEYRGDTNPVKETIKKEILATANASLRKGSGSIHDVYYEQFLIK